jgi:hypothetical protein
VSTGIFAENNSSREPFARHVPAVTMDLALAVIAFSDAPPLLLDGTLKIIVAGKSLCRVFGIGPAAIYGRGLPVLARANGERPKSRHHCVPSLPGL